MVEFELETHPMAPRLNQQMNEVYDKVLNSIEQQLETWLKGELQTKFTDLNWQDREQVRTALGTAGYALELNGFGEYILYQNKEEISRHKIQINFSR